MPDDMRPGQYRDELLAWLEANQLDPRRIPIDSPIFYDPDLKQITTNVITDCTPHGRPNVQQIIVKARVSWLERERR